MSSRVARMAVSRSSRCASSVSSRPRTSANSSAANGLLAPRSWKRRRKRRQPRRARTVRLASEPVRRSDSRLPRARSPHRGRLEQRLVGGFCRRGRIVGPVDGDPVRPSGSARPPRARAARPSAPMPASSTSSCSRAARAGAEPPSRPPRRRGCGLRPRAVARARRRPRRSARQRGARSSPLSPPALECLRQAARSGRPRLAAATRVSRRRRSAAPGPARREARSCSVTSSSTSRARPWPA